MKDRFENINDWMEKIMCKKKLYIMLMILILLCIGGCNKKGSLENVNEDQKDETTKVKSKKKQKNNETSEANGDIDNNSKDKIIYENSNFGFKLSFPADWKDYYLIDETFEDHIGVYFIGESIRSKGENGKGLLIFLIFAGEIDDDEARFLDSVKQIGNAHGQKYYYATSTDAPIGALVDFIEDIKDDNEKKLMQKDFDKFRSMDEHDVIQEILDTFEEIPLAPGTTKQSLSKAEHYVTKGENHMNAGDIDAAIEYS